MYKIFNFYHQNFTKIIPVFKNFVNNNNKLSQKVCTKIKIYYHMIKFKRDEEEVPANYNNSTKNTAEKSTHGMQIKF